MFKRAIDVLAPAGGFPKKRIAVYGEEIVAPPSVYNLYSEVSRLPVTEEIFSHKSGEPGFVIGCCAGVSGTSRRVSIGEMNANRKKVVLGTYKRYLSAKEDRMKREKMIEMMKSKGMAIGPELRAALERERMREQEWKKRYEEESGLGAWPRVRKKVSWWEKFRLWLWGKPAPKALPVYGGVYGRKMLLESEKF